MHTQVGIVGDLFLVDDFHSASFDSDSAFDRRRQLGELDCVTSSRTAAQNHAENYVGLPVDNHV